VGRETPRSRLPLTRCSGPGCPSRVPGRKPKNPTERGQRRSAGQGGKLRRRPRTRPGFARIFGSAASAHEPTPSQHPVTRSQEQPRCRNRLPMPCCPSTTGSRCVALPRTPDPEGQRWRHSTIQFIGAIAAVLERGGPACSSPCRYLGRAGCRRSGLTAALDSASAPPIPDG
jgi:hypothetical protein